MSTFTIKQSIRILQLLKIAVEQGLLFNIPPVPTEHPEMEKGYYNKNKRRIYPHSQNESYICGMCGGSIPEDEVAYWREGKEEIQYSYDPIKDRQALTKTLAALEEAKELTETFIEEYQKLPPIDEDAPFDKRWEMKLPYTTLVDDFNNSLHNIPTEFFKNEEIYKEVSWLTNRKIYIQNNVGRALEEAHSIIRAIDDRILEIKKTGIQPVKYNIVFMEPICEDCFEENRVSCDWCGEKGLLQGKNYDDKNFVEINDDKYLCRKCYENNASSCEECGKVISSDEAYYDEKGEATYCASCYAQRPSYDTAPVKKFVKEFSNTETYLPVDTKQIEKTIIPKVLNPLRNKPFSIDAIERQANKAGLSNDLKIFLLTTAKNKDFQSIDELISKLSRQVETEKKYKQEYPALKKFQKLPLVISTEDESDRDMPSFTLTIKPAKELIDYSETLFPGAGEKALKILSQRGHHPGAMAYARIGYDRDKDAFVINNLQTDADMQSLMHSDDRDSVGGELSDNLKPLEPAIRWWLKQFENWPAQLLDIIHSFGRQANKAVYLTNFDMQKDKWDRIPERNKDVYDKIPTLMGFKPENIRMNVETLGNDYYEMYRVAHINHNFRPKTLFRVIKLANICSSDRNIRHQALALAMAISDLEPGTQIEEDNDWAGYSANTTTTAKTFDYSHILTPQQRLAGYSLEVKRHKKQIIPYSPEIPESRYRIYAVILRFHDEIIGEMDGNVKDGKLEPHSQIYEKEHMGKGLGQKMYEALYRQALEDGINQVKGGRHTENASKVHKRLTQEHNISGYKPSPQYDYRYPYPPYEYEIK